MKDEKRELEGFRHRVFFDEVKGVLHVEVVGRITPEGYIALNKACNAWESGKPNKVIIDLTETDMSSMIPWDRETRKKVKEETEPFAPNAKVAVIGLKSSSISKLVMKITLGILGVLKNGRFFNTEDEASAWLAK